MDLLLPHHREGLCAIRPIEMGPAWTGVIRTVSVIKFTVMTVCNLPLWEYSRDKPGTRGSKCLWQGQAAPRVPINTPVLCPGKGRWMKLLAFRVKLCKHFFYFLVRSTCPGEEVPTATYSSEVTGILKIILVPGISSPRQVVPLITPFYLIMFVVNHCDMLRLIWWDLIGFPSIVYSPPCKQMNY
jgi:hypothetical protein